MEKKQIEKEFKALRLLLSLASKELRSFNTPSSMDSSSPEIEINDIKGLPEMRMLRKDVQKVLQNFFADCRKPNPEGKTRKVNYEDWADCMIMIFIDNNWKSS